MDLRKAYDIMTWEAIEFALYRIGVPKKFRDWVQVYVQTMGHSIMVNRETHGYFRGKRGIRQIPPGICHNNKCINVDRW